MFKCNRLHQNEPLTGEFRLEGDKFLSVTQNVYAQNGKLFGGLYDKELGLTKSLSINVFDTPGFSDANIENIRKNKLLIASAIKHQIHMIIFLVGPRFDANMFVLR